MRENLRLAVGATALVAGSLFLGGNVFAEGESYGAETFTDAGFFACVKEAVTGAGDTITPEQAASITSLKCDATKNIKSIVGIDKLTGLTNLSISHATGLTELDFTGLSSLTDIDVSESPKLATVKFSGNTGLKGIKISDAAALTAVDLTGAPNLETANLYDNNISSATVSANTKMYELVLSKNNLTTIDLSGCSSLNDVYLYENKITTLDISKVSSHISALYLDDNVLVNTGFVARQTIDGGAYYAGFTTSGSMFNTMVVASGLFGGRSKITTADASYSTTGCATGDISCITFSSSVAKDTKYIQLAYNTSSPTASTDASDAGRGLDRRKLNWRIGIDLSAYVAPVDPEDEEGAVDAEGRPIKTPDTGLFGGNANAGIITGSVLGVAAASGVAYAVIYSKKRITNRRKFNK